MTKIIITDKAQDDLISLIQYTEATYGYEQKEIYAKNFNQALERLSKCPEIGHTRRDVPQDCRSYMVGAHCIIYLFSKKINTLVVFRVLHSKMDFTNKV